MRKQLKSHPELINGPILDAMPAVIQVTVFPTKTSIFTQAYRRTRTLVNVTFEQHSLGKHG